MNPAQFVLIAILLATFILLYFVKMSRTASRLNFAGISETINRLTEERDKLNKELKKLEETQACKNTMAEYVNGLNKLLGNLKQIKTENKHVQYVNRMTFNADWVFLLEPAKDTVMYVVAPETTPVFVKQPCYVYVTRSGDDPKNVARYIQGKNPDLIVLILQGVRP